jgi:hypothetical protein
MMFIDNTILVLKTYNTVTDSPSTLRGFIGQKFPENTILHHHLNNGSTKLIYSYPKVQYKILNGCPMVLGIGEAVEIVKEISIISHLDLKGKRYIVTDKKLIEEKVNYGVAADVISYEFLTPWLALDEQSFDRYKKRNQGEKQKQLESILVGNIISMAKGLEYVITDKIIAKVNVHEVPTSLKGTPMLGFLGHFSVNFEIPDYWGIGKSVSRGFGTIKRVSELRS